jgi:hypothetical protein
MRKEKRNAEDWDFFYLICVPQIESCCLAYGREVSSFSWSSRLPFSQSCHVGWFHVVDVWDRSPLVVNEVSHGPNGIEVKTLTPPHTISIVGPCTAALALPK